MVSGGRFRSGAGKCLPLLSGVGNVAARCIAQLLLFVRSQVPDDPRRYPRDERAGGNFKTRRYERTGGDKGTRMNDRTVEYGGSHADQAGILNRASVNYRAVTDGNVIPYVCRVGVVRNVYDTVILYITARSNAYVVNISAHDRVEPDARPGSDRDIAYDPRAGRKERRLVQDRVCTVEGYQVRRVRRRIGIILKTIH